MLRKVPGMVISVIAVVVMIIIMCKNNFKFKLPPHKPTGQILQTAGALPNVRESYRPLTSSRLSVWLHVT